MIKKIISGGQTGVDRAALDVALKLHIPHGGWIPKGRKAEDGTLSEIYRLKEMPTDSYPARTEQNVIDSDGTLIIARGKLTGGTDYTRQMTLKHKKQLLCIIKGNHVLVPVTLGYGSRKTEVLLLLDTGASITTLHQQVAEQLNINKMQSVMLTLAGGQKIESAVAKLNYVQVGPVVKKIFMLVLLSIRALKMDFRDFSG